MSNGPEFLGRSVLKTGKFCASWDEGSPRSRPRRGAAPGPLGDGPCSSPVQGCSLLPSPLPPEPGARGPGRPPAHKAAPVIGALEPRCAACGRVTGGGRHLRRTCLAAAAGTTRAGRGRGGASRARELGEGGRPAAPGAGPPPRRRKASPSAGAEPPRRLPLGAGWLICNSPHPRGLQAPSHGGEGGLGAPAFPGGVSHGLSGALLKDCCWGMRLEAKGGPFNGRVGTPRVPGALHEAVRALPWWGARGQVKASAGEGRRAGLGWGAPHVGCTRGLGHPRAAPCPPQMPPLPPGPGGCPGRCTGETLTSFSVFALTSPSQSPGEGLKAGDRHESATSAG